MRFFLFIFLWVYGMLGIAQQSVSFGASSLAFTENLGQIIDTDGNVRDDILFSAKSNGAKWFLQKDRMSIVFYQYEKNREEASENHLGGLDEVDAGKPSMKAHRVDMVFEGCNTHHIIRTEGQSPDYVNYFLPHCQNGLKGVRKFEKVIYENVYDHIDFQIYGYGNGLKYDWIVHPEGDLADIGVRIEGATELSNEDDAVIVATTLGDLFDRDFCVFQNGQTLAAHVILDEQTVSFEIEDLDQEDELIIDPVLRWSTLLGGNGDDYVHDVHVLGDEVMAVGTTLSDDFPVTTGAYQEDIGSPIDAYIAKFNLNGEQQWITFFGGSGHDRWGEIQQNEAGSIFVCFSSTSADMPAIDYSESQLEETESYDLLIAKFTNEGLLVTGRMIGGSWSDEARDMELEDNMLAIVGHTESSDFPISPNAIQSDLANSSGTRDLLIMQLDTALTTEFISFLGGDMLDDAHSISINDQSLWITGYTLSTDFPLTPNAQFATTSAESNGFMCVISSDLELTYSSFIQDAAEETHAQGRAWVSTPSGSSYLAGVAMDGPLFDGQFDLGDPVEFLLFHLQAFVTHYDSEFNPVWVRYLNGSYDQMVNDSSIDIWQDNVVVSGFTSSLDFPVTNDALQYYNGFNPSILPATFDGFMALITPQGEVDYCTYLGGEDVNYMNGQSLSPSGELVLGGHASPFFPTTPDSFQNQLDFDPFNGLSQQDAGFVTRISLEETFLSYDDGVGIDHCIEEDIVINFESSTEFEDDNVFQILILDSVSDPGGQVIQTIEGGTLESFILSFDGTTPPGHYIIKVVSSSPEITDLGGILNLHLWDYTPPQFVNEISVCVNANTLLLDIAVPDYSATNFFLGHAAYFGPGVDIEMPVFFNPEIAGVGIHEIGYTITNACLTDTAFAQIEVVAEPDVILTPFNVCETADSVELVFADPPGGIWGGGDYVNDGFFYPQVPGEYYVNYWYTNICGTFGENMNVEVSSAPDVSYILEDSLCIDLGEIDLPEPDTPGGEFFIDGIQVSGLELPVLGTGSFELIYELEDSLCGVMTFADSIWIEESYQPTVMLPDSLCEDGEPVLIEFSPIGGELLGMGVDDGIFDPQQALLGINVISYSMTNSCGTIVAQDSVVISPVPNTPQITQDGNTLTSSSVDGNQWYFNGQIIEGETGFTLEMEESGEYSLQVIIDGCMSQIFQENFEYVGIHDNETSGIEIFPNPSSDGRFMLRVDCPGPKELTIYDAIGKTVHRSAFTQNHTRFKLISPGMYTVEVKCGGQVVHQAIVVE